jgi:NADH-quinone oxidoreductase subunit E
MLAHAEEKLGVKLGETTGDGRITLVREEECLAGCCGAPMAVVDGHYHEKLDMQKLDAILDGLE